MEDAVRARRIISPGHGSARAGQVDGVNPRGTIVVWWASTRLRYHRWHHDVIHVSHGVSVGNHEWLGVQTLPEELRNAELAPVCLTCWDVEHA